MAKILVVDDEKAILVMIQKILTREGHEVIIVDQSREVLNQNLSGFDFNIQTCCSICMGR